MVHAGALAQAGQRTGDQVGLGGVQVAAARVHAQGPAGVSGLLPGAQAERVLEELADRGSIHSARFHATDAKSRLVPWALLGGCERQAQQLGAVIAAEGIGLGLPLQVGQGARVTARMVLCTVVISERGLDGIRRRGGRRGRGLHGRTAGGGEGALPAEAARETANGASRASVTMSRPAPDSAHSA